MKKILFISTGGTIASRRGKDGLTPVMGSEELLKYAPHIKDFAQVNTLELLNLDSTNVTPKHWLMIANAIKENYDNYDGFVVSHGTDTMAYTASALSYLIQNSAKPIVITGSQKPIDMEGTDAIKNLRDSFSYAACDDAHGVQIVFSGNVILGTRAKKTHSKNYNAFSSMNFPAVAAIRDGKIFHYVDTTPKGEVQFYDKLCEKVGVIKLTPGASCDLLEFYLQHHQAVIIESFGTGGLPQTEENDFMSVVRKYTDLGKVIVMTTQVLNDGSDMSVYQVGGAIKKECHMMEAYDMTTEAAYAKLMWILSLTSDPMAVEALFYKTVWFDILYSQN